MKKYEETFFKCHSWAAVGNGCVSEALSKSDLISFMMWQLAKV